MREDYNENLLKLINERKELLEGSLKSKISSSSWLMEANGPGSVNCVALKRRTQAEADTLTICGVPPGGGVSPWARLAV